MTEGQYHPKHPPILREVGAAITGTQLGREFVGIYQTWTRIQNPLMEVVVGIAYLGKRLTCGIARTCEL
jgi:hypothetical protein